MRAFGLLAFVASALLLSAAPARAEPAAAPPPAPGAEVAGPEATPGAAGAARLPREGRLSLDVSFLSGYPDLLGASLSWALPRVPLELQAGARVLFGQYLRAGVLLLSRNRCDAAGQGWTVEVPLMLGFIRSAGSAGGYLPFKGADLTAHVAGVYWVGPSFGWSIRVTAGYGFGVQTRDASGPTLERHSTLVQPTVRLAFGVAFR